MLEGPTAGRRRPCRPRSGWSAGTTGTTSRPSTSTTPASSTSRRSSRHVIAALREAACRAFIALDCAGLARVDFFVTPDERVVVNEVNTMPGFTPISMFPQMWAATGVEYPELVDRLITAALRRHSA